MVLTYLQHARLRAFYAQLGHKGVSFEILASIIGTSAIAMLSSALSQEMR